MTNSIDRRDFLVQSGNVALTTLALARATRAFRLSPMTELEKQLPLLMKEHHVPGVSLAVISGAKMAERRAFGVKDSASTVPVDDATMFEAASMSKPVFAYAVLKLCERGVIDLDTPLTHYTSSRFLTGDARLDLITVCVSRRATHDADGLCEVHVGNPRAKRPRPVPAESLHHRANGASASRNA